MPEKEQQLMPNNEAREKGQRPHMVYESWEETAKKLSKMGVEQENIVAAFAAMRVISFFDKKIFPDKPAIFGFVPPETENPLKHSAGFRWPEEEGREGERLYGIWTKDFAKFLREEMGRKVPIFGQKGGLKWEKQRHPNILLAAHEVRHRVQRDCRIKQFTPGDAGLVQDELLRNTINFLKILFEEEEKIYRRDGKSESFISQKLNPKEFDARVIEKFIANIIHKKLIRASSALEPADLDEIASIIQMAAPEQDKKP